MKTAREMEDELQALIDSAVKDNQSAQDQLRELGGKGQARRDGGELDGELNENNIARNKKMREDEENRLLAAKSINATVTEAVQMVQGGLKLLEQTFEVNSENTKALGRVLQAIDSGTLTVNGQAPDKDYAIGEYLIHGGRVKFDVSQLDATQQKQFFQFITNKQAENRPFATHRAGGVDASGHSAEIKSGLWGAVVDLGRYLINKSNHYGINLAVGGRQPSKQGPGKTQIPDESGQWGHMYLHKDKNIVLVGIEASAPNKHNLRTGEAHSKTGGAGEYSAFLEYKINSTALQDDQKKDNKCPLSTKEKNNWANISISPEQFKKLKIQVSSIESTNSQDGYSKLVNKTPSNATEAASDRFEQMSNWASATKKGNKTSFLAKALGVLMIVAGIVLAAVPIPIVTQALGGGLIADGRATS